MNQICPSVFQTRLSNKFSNEPAEYHTLFLSSQGESKTVLRQKCTSFEEIFGIAPIIVNVVFFCNENKQE